MAKEQMRNKKGLTKSITVYTLSPCMGRPPKPKNLRRSKLFPLRLTPSEMADLEAASRELGVTVAEIFRAGAALYIRKKGKGGHREGRKR